MRRTVLYYGLAGVLLSTFLGCSFTNWDENYDLEGKQPFDLLALRELLAARPGGLSVLRDTADLHRLDTLSSSTYLYIGDYPYYSDATVERLLAYVARGNTAFIAANTLPEGLATQLFGDYCPENEDYGPSTDFTEVYLDTVTAFRYPSGDSFELVNTRFWRTEYVGLRIMDDGLLCDPALDNQVLGGIDTAGINFVRIGWGTGDFYLHSNPLFFTNWFVLDSSQYRYPEAVLEVIGDGPVVWDEFDRRYRRSAAANREIPRDYTGGRNLLTGNETLRYIQEHRELAFAWYTLLVGVLLYVIFRGKRRQRVIPIQAAKENSSRRFIDTISRLVHEKGNHSALAQRELASLRFHLNARFGLRWSEGNPPPAELIERIELSAEVTERALSQIRLVAAGRPLGEGDLLRFYRAIEPLYRI
ncbi:uncharacterized protein DUF4350 [Neolewinella xylanilytica]|uniref:Uncharacterized protein DUF4350 n=1 Tax=Neolewinella xylanilytica TaxID=1514080 RepID=A0A2S6I7R6_9BACT|nr:DUF4350 domain-containing protein [Neolewinella xylanilytica]PPK87541.1 uncharacterized protein DUF4350 [Neolewinella xylanilytica]